MKTVFLLLTIFPATFSSACGDLLMLDLFFVALTLLLFVLAGGYVRACEKL